MSFVKEKLALLKKDIEGNLFKEFELVGWYSTGTNSQPYTNDMNF